MADMLYDATPRGTRGGMADSRQHCMMYYCLAACLSIEQAAQRPMLVCSLYQELSSSVGTSPIRVEARHVKLPSAVGMGSVPISRYLPSHHQMQG